MLVKVYIGDFYDKVKIEVSHYFSSVKFIDCDNLDIQDIVNFHRKGLFPATKKVCLFNLDCVEAALLLKVLDKKIEADVIWCFSSLAKTTKLYKKLNVVSSIEHVKDKLDKVEKKRIIGSYLGHGEVDSDILGLLASRSITNVSVLHNECKKLKVASSVLKANELGKVVVDYTTDKDALDFVTNLFSNNITEAYGLISKLSNHNPVHVSLILLKKIKSLIFLSKGLVKESQGVWYTPDYFLKQATGVAKGMGYSKLLELYSYVFTEVYDLYSSKSIECRLKNLVMYMYLEKLLKNTI